MSELDAVADRTDRLLEKHSRFIGPRRRNSVVLVGDDAYLRTQVGQIAWVTTVNLTARLFKGFDRVRVVVPAGIARLPNTIVPNGCTNLCEATLVLLDQLNPRHFSVEEGLPNVIDDSWAIVCVGGATNPADNAVTVSGVGWLAFVNRNALKIDPLDNNPIGAIVAACLGVAELYKLLYPLRRPSPRASFVFSTFNYLCGDDAANPPLPVFHLPRTFVAGAGALGMAFLYAVASTAQLASSEGLDVVDFDGIDYSNLNRCIFAVLQDVVGKVPKLTIVGRCIGISGLGYRPHETTWQEFVEQSAFADNRHYERVISCVDKYVARRAVQFDRIPRLLLTGGTTDFLMTISRHRLNDELSCGVCYQAREKQMPCGQASEGAQQTFEAPVDPSIGFVSVLAGTLLFAEYLKEIVPNLASAQVRNSVRVNALALSAAIRARPKDPRCNCSSRYVRMGYEAVWL